MKTIGALVAGLLSFSSAALAEIDFDSEIQRLDTSVESIDLSADLSNADLETLFQKQDKQFPDQVAAMIAAEHDAWAEHSAKIEKHLTHYGIDYHRSYREGFRRSYYNGYRYANRHRAGYVYRTPYTHRSAYSYSYWWSARSYSRHVYGSYNSYARINVGFRHGYSYAYLYGYRQGC